MRNARAACPDSAQAASCILSRAASPASDLGALKLLSGGTENICDCVCLRKKDGSSGREREAAPEADDIQRSHSISFLVSMDGKPKQLSMSIPARHREEYLNVRVQRRRCDKDAPVDIARRTFST